MTTPLAFELDDALIERMLARRAGGPAPTGLLRDVIGDIGSQRQSRRVWPPVRVGRARDLRLVLVAVGLVALLVAGLLVAGAVPKLVPNVAPPSASSVATPTPISSSSTLLPQPAAGQPIAVLDITASHTLVYSLDLGTGTRGPVAQLQQLTGRSGEHIQLASDGIHAVVFRDTDALLAEVDLGTGAVRPLTSLLATGNRDNVSPDGTRTARFDDAGDIRVLDLDGNEVARVDMPTKLQPSLGLAWSPTGSSVLANGCLLARGACKTDGYHLYLVALDGSGPPVESLAQGNGFYGSMGWSPDGTTIVATGPGSGGIWLRRLNDGQATQVTTNGADDFAVFSPDGSRIAFWRSRGLEVVRSDGSGITEVATQDGARGEPRWSPDGNWLLVNTGSESGAGDVWLVPAAGGQPQVIVQHAIADW